MLSYSCFKYDHVIPWQSKSDEMSCGESAAQRLFSVYCCTAMCSYELRLGPGRFIGFPELDRSLLEEFAFVWFCLAQDVTWSRGCDSKSGLPGVVDSSRWPPCDRHQLRKVGEVRARRIEVSASFVTHPYWSHEYNRITAGSVRHLQVRS